jgi:putative FmdB family regulatory protein
VPLYEYQCRKCHHRFEEIQKVSARPITRCPRCRTGKVEKLISAPAVHFKGTGWYVTDYAGKGKADKQDKADAQDKGDKADKPGKSDATGKTDKAGTGDAGGKETKAGKGGKSAGKD